MKTFFSRWESWWLGDIHPHALALLRIAFGLFLLVYVSTFSPFTKLLFSNEGWAVSYFAYEAPTWVQPLLYPPAPWIAYLLMALAYVLIVCFTVGYQFRAATMGLIIYSLYAWQLQLHMFPASYNRLLLMFLFFFSFSGADKTFSYYAYKHHSSVFAWEYISALSHRLMAVQITLTYAGVGLQKFVLHAWVGGEVLAYSLIGRWATPFAFWYSRLAIPLWITDLLVESIKALELFIPIGFWVRSLRPWSIAAAVVFHLSIIFFLGIWWFVVLFPTYMLFYPPQNVFLWLHERYPHHIPKHAQTIKS